MLFSFFVQFHLEDSRSTHFKIRVKKKEATVLSKKVDFLQTMDILSPKIQRLLKPSSKCSFLLLKTIYLNQDCQLYLTKFETFCNLFYTGLKKRTKNEEKRGSSINHFSKNKIMKTFNTIGVLKSKGF